MKKSAVMASSLAELNKLPLEEARKRLAKFPMIGMPGADRILLFTGTFDTFALESNGLRVLLRIGFGKEGKSYAASYRSAMEAVVPQLPERSAERIALHQRLRQHGLLLCKRSRPLCEQCSLRPHCRHGLRGPIT
jgi:endonuclease III